MELTLPNWIIFGALIGSLGTFMLYVIVSGQDGEHRQSRARHGAAWKVQR